MIKRWKKTDRKKSQSIGISEKKSIICRESLLHLAAFMSRFQFLPFFHPILNLHTTTSSPPQFSSNYCFYTTILTWQTPTLLTFIQMYTKVCSKRETVFVLSPPH